MRNVVAIVLAWAALGSMPAMAVELPVARDLQADGRASDRARLPILVFFASHDCPYCKEVEQLYLKPMQASAEYADKVMIRVIYADSTSRLYDFNGRKSDHAAIARSYAVRFTPTIKMVDSSGMELSPALVGLTTRDFYGFYLEDVISDALKKLRTPKLTGLH